MTEKEAIESIKYLKEQLKEDDPSDMFFYTTYEIEAMEIAITALTEIQKYREIGEIEELRNLRNEIHRLIRINEIQGDLIDAYEAIGTVKECRTAMEKMKQEQNIKE